MQLSAKGADAELTKDSIVSALGYTPEAADEGFKLIESLALTEETTTIDRSEYPDGTLYNFKEVKIYVRGKMSNSGHALLYLNGRNDEYICTIPSSTTENSWGFAHLKMRGELIDVHFGGAGYTGAEQARFNPSTVENYAKNKTIITSVRIYRQNAFPVGAQIRIYGIVAI